MLPINQQLRYFRDFYFGSVLSGFMIGTSYIPYPAWAIAFCYLPLWWNVLKAHKHSQLDAQNKSNIKLYVMVFLQGWISQFILTLIGFNWLFYTAQEFGHLPDTLSLVILLLFASLMHIYIPLALVFATYIKQRFRLSTPQFILTIAICHILFERIWPSIFEWNLGYTLLWMKWPIAQWADTVGFWGLSALIFIIQSYFLMAYWLYQNQKIKQSAYTIIGTLSVIVVLWVTGLYKYSKATEKLDSSLNVVIVQANVTNEEKLQSEKGYTYQGFVVEKYIAETSKILNQYPQTNLVFWPETALPMALDTSFHNRPNQNKVIQAVRNWNLQLVTGAYSQDLFKLDHLGHNLIRNSVFFIGPQGETASAYNKTDLLAFGEYMPFGQDFPFLYKLLPFVGTYERGPGPVIKSVPVKSLNEPLRLGPQICYESLNPGFSRQLARSGAQIIFNLTNDSWFGWWAEPYQHMMMTLARGLENRRPLIRSTNTGISSVILANGDELSRSPIGEIWAGSYNVKYQNNPHLTVYAQFGYLDWILWLFLLLLIILRGHHARTQKS